MKFDVEEIGGNFKPVTLIKTFSSESNFTLEAVESLMT